MELPQCRYRLLDRSASGGRFITHRVPRVNAGRVLSGKTNISAANYKFRLRLTAVDLCIANLALSHPATKICRWARVEHFRSGASPFPWHMRDINEGSVLSVVLVAELPCKLKCGMAGVEIRFSDNIYVPAGVLVLARTSGDMYLVFGDGQ